MVGGRYRRGLRGGRKKKMMSRSTQTGLRRVQQGYNRSRWTPGVSLCPDNMFVKLKYTAIFTLLPGANVASRIFRGNSFMDPDVSAGGPSVPAYGALIWNNLYNKAYVSSSYMHCKIMPNDQTTVQCTLYPATFAVSPQTIENSTSRARSRSLLLQAGEGPVYLSQKCSTHAVTGEFKNVNQTFQLGTANNPGIPIEEFFWIIAAKSINGTASTIDVSVTITYNVQLYNRLPVLGDISGTPA